MSSHLSLNAQLLNHQCDYHMHSTASDGALTPSQLMALAAQEGLKEVALTDHDTFNGLEEASVAAQNLGINLIAGMEFSCSWQGITLHLVTLWPQGLTPAAKALAAQQKTARWSRAEQIIQRLSKTPAALKLEDVLVHSHGQVPGRPHFAQAMLDAGVVENINQAFRRWLGSGKLGDIKNHWLPLEEALQQLTAAGAWVSLAHPNYYKLTRSKRRRLLEFFKQAGGQAVEVVSGQQDPQQTQSLLRQAQELGLQLSWGSDFHQPGVICAAPGRYAQLPAECQPLSQLLN